MRASASPQGHPSGSRSPAEVPANVAPVEVPPPPITISRDPEALADWRNVWTIGHGTYRPDRDAFVVERYCTLLQRRRELLRILASEGVTTQGSQGQPVAHPAARLLGDLEAKLTPLEDRLGLSPEAAIRLGIAATEAKTKLDEFLERHGGES